MLTLRLLGGALMLGAGIALSYLLIHRERTRLSVLNAWVELITYIRTQIDCFLTPLDEILANADPALLRDCMFRGEACTLKGLLQASRPYLDDETARQLTAFVKELGGSYRDEQVKRCDYYLHALRTLREARAAQLPQRTRLCATLCLCGTAGVLILLW